jgi:hypothetical protein
MSPDKRDLPLVVLEELEKYSKRSSELIKVENKGDVLLRFVDNHPNPKQYFEFIKFDNSNGKQKLTLSIKPKNSTDPSGHNISVEVGKIDPHFKNWLTCLERYKKVEIFEDPLIKQYESEFYSEFEILDEDADVNSYSMETQIWLNEYIERSLIKLSEYDPDNNKEIQDIKLNLEELRDTQTRLTKKKVLKKLSQILAKARKHGLKLLGELYIEARKELIKQLVSGKIEIM